MDVPSKQFERDIVEEIISFAHGTEDPAGTVQRITDFAFSSLNEVKRLGNEYLHSRLRPGAERDAGPSKTLSPKGPREK